MRDGLCPALRGGCLSRATMLRPFAEEWPPAIWVQISRRITGIRLRQI